MKLGIITDCTHYTLPDGSIGTENHILLRQLTQLCSHFSSVVICCPFATYNPSKVITTYVEENISFIKLPLVGGDAITDKVKLLAAVPRWLQAFRHINAQSDVVYQRFPNNLNIPGFLYFWLNKKKVFATYTGTWSGYQSEPFTYRFQRWILRQPFRGPVWVYTEKDEQQGRIQSGFSPSYSMLEWQEEAGQVQQRIERITAEGLSVLRLITVGTLIDYKNQLAILKACKTLKDRSIPFVLSVVGDGPMKQELEDFISKNKLQAQVKILGKKNHVELRQLYREHDFVVQAPLKEGFGKVPVEGFFHGVIPVINNISMASSMIGNGERGFLFNANNENELADTFQSLFDRVDLLPLMIENGRTYARTQTLEAWAENYYHTLVSYYSEV